MKLKAIRSKNPQDWGEFKHQDHKGILLQNHLLNTKMTHDAPGKL